MPSSDHLPAEHEDPCRLLDRCIRLAGELQAAMDREQGALRRRDLPALNAAAGDKTRLVTALDTLEQPLSRAREAPNTPAVQQRWSELARLLEACRHANRKNGATVEMQRRHNDRLLAILHGIENHQPLYGARGEARAVRHSRYAARA